MNQRAEYFLDLYRQIEEILSSKYKGKKGEAGPVRYFVSTPEGKPYREELNVCREIRNLLSHSPRINGVAAVTPSEESISFLEKLMHRMENPPLAIEYATETKNIVFASLEDNALHLMRKMEMKGYSHIPVMDKGKFTGIFSISTVFSYVIDNPDYMIEATTKIKFFRDYLPIENHMSETFMFTHPKADYWTVRELIERKKTPHKRLAAIFITSDGTKNGKILGMLTPWDIIKEEIENNDEI